MTFLWVSFDGLFAGTCQNVHRARAGRDPLQASETRKTAR
jgi:hypothetical protein